MCIIGGYVPRVLIIGDPEVGAPRGCEVPRLQHMPRSADSSIKEESCRSADVSWLMSYGGNRVSALPSIMEFVADHWLRPSPSQTMLEQGGTCSDATPCVHIHFNSSAVLNSLFVIFLSFFPSCIVACAVSRPIYHIQNLGTYLTTACLSHALTAKIAIRGNTGSSTQGPHFLLGFPITGILSGRVPPPCRRTWQSSFCNLTRARTTLPWTAMRAIGTHPFPHLERRFTVAQD